MTYDESEKHDLGLVAADRQMEQFSNAEKKNLTLLDETDSPISVSEAESGYDDAGATSPLQIIRRLMRGRYHWAVILGVIGGTIGGMIGYRGGRQLYQSVGEIRVLPVVPIVLHRIDENEQIPMFDEYIDAQVAIARSQSVVMNAMQSDTWQQTRRGLSDADLLKFMSQLNVVKQGDLIQISFTDPDSNAALVATRAVVGAYLNAYQAQDTTNGKTRNELLAGREQTWLDEKENLRKQILAVATPYGSDDLGSVIAFRQAEANKLQASLHELELARAIKLGQIATTQSSATATELTVDEIAAMDGRMRSYVQDRDARKQQIVELQVHQVLDDNPQMVFARAMLDVDNKQINEYAADFRTYWAKKQSTAVSGASSNLANLSVEDIDAQYKPIKQLYDKAYEELLTLGRDDLHMKELKAGVETAQQHIDEFKSRLEQLDVESSLSGRLNVISSGDRPLQPFRDTRITNAWAGGMGGGIIGVALVIAIGFFSRRLTSPEDAQTGLVACPILGVLPTLEADRSDPDTAALAAHSLHSIRALLQVSSGEHPIFGVTSPTPGSGKSSLTVSLGISFATAGAKTLLIDIDLIGRGLSSRTDPSIRRRLGRVLMKQGLINLAQLNSAIAEVPLSHPRRMIGEILVARGEVSAENVNRALTIQEGTKVGLFDVLEGSRLEDCVASTGIRNLWVLGVGDANPDNAHRLSPRTLSALLKRAREKFDVVLIDTGPIPGSVEASLVAAEVDGVILTVARGESRALMQQCVRRLQMVKASVAGIVFNRVRSRELVRYGSISATTSSGRVIPIDPESVEDGTLAEIAERLGPMPAAVINSGGASKSFPKAPRMAVVG